MFVRKIIWGMMLALCVVGLSAAQEPTPDNTGLVARVNEVGITEQDFNAMIAPMLANAQPSELSLLQSMVLESLIQQELTTQAAAQMGINVTQADVNAEIERLKATIADEAAWQQFLDLNGFTEAELMAAQYPILLNMRLQEQLMQDYQGAVPQVRARHILVATEAEAAAVLRRLQAGEAFAQVAQDVSIDRTSSENGGLLGWFVPAEMVDPRLAEVAFSLQPNQIAGPIISSIGYHIVQTLEIAERPIEPGRLSVVAESVYNNWLMEQMQNADIEVYR